MKVIVEAKNHKHFEEVTRYYKETISEKYEKIPFLTSAYVNITPDQNQRTKVSLQLNAKKGAKFFSSASSNKESTAFKNAQEKLENQIAKFKTKHYQGIHKS